MHTQNLTVLSGFSMTA